MYTEHPVEDSVKNDAPPVSGEGASESFTHQSYGFVAQEEALVYADAVTQGDDGEEITRQWGRDDSKLVPLLVKEIQSLRARVAALEA